MTIPFPALTWNIAVAGVSLVCLFPLCIVAFSRKRRFLFWACLCSALATLLSGFAAFKRLELIHGELLVGSPRIVDQADLLRHYGRPTSTKKYLDGKQEVECWIYEVRWLRPTIMTQFEMVDGKVLAKVSANNI